jgi:hypothetical protein
MATRATGIPMMTLNSTPAVLGVAGSLYRAPVWVAGNPKHRWKFCRVPVPNAHAFVSYGLAKAAS